MLDRYPDQYRYGQWNAFVGLSPMRALHRLIANLVQRAHFLDLDRERAVSLFGKIEYIRFHNQLTRPVAAIYLRRGHLLGRAHFAARMARKPMDLGHHRIHGCTHHRVGESGHDIRVRVLKPADILCLTSRRSLWTKYTLAAIPGSLAFALVSLPLYQWIAPMVGGP